MISETAFEIISRLQQQIDHIDDQIVLKRGRIRTCNFDGPVQRKIENEITELLERRKAISERILALKISIQKPNITTT